MTTPQRHAFHGLYEQHYPNVLAYCIRRAGHTDAQDVAAEVFMIAWRKIDEVPADDGALPWLYGVAYRVISHQWRSNRRYSRLAARLASLRKGQEPSPEVQVVRRLEDQAVAAAVARLRSADQEVLRLAGWEGLPHSDIARILGCSGAAVGQRLHRAKKRLAREIRASGPQWLQPPRVLGKEEAND
jgi:RNA polymerase sigma-70 factor (ECF subfamily)